MHVSWQRIQTSERLVHAGGYALCVREIIRGDKPAVLLVHGLGVSSEYYAAYAEQLAAHYSVYAVDLPGYGASPKPPKALSIAGLSKVLTALVAELQIEQCAVVGQSMGCQIIAHALADRPKLFSKAIMIAPTVYAKERSVLMQGFRLFQDTFKESIDANTIVLKNYIKMRPFRFLATAKAMVRDSIEENLEASNADLLFIVGSKDVIAPKAWADSLAARTKRGTVRELNAPHLVHMQVPVELAHITHEFIGS
jgi:pimeloyl-ACP methyl ester carboxylesterase